ncbi:MAG: putative diacylglycerol O-acyltransferase [Acidimicrobiales bacterium]|nr:putative diacylglycerol O-acyltransferase [Acidimicrobiales bacterium]
MQWLSGMDASFLYMETPAAHMHVAGMLILDPSDAPVPYSFGHAREIIESRLPLMQPFRKRLLSPPLGIDHPVWVDDPGFDLDRHLFRTAIPSPGTSRELAALAGRVASKPLDRSKPLWEMYLVEGLEGDRVAIITKIHHSAIDGVTGADLMAHLVDFEPEVAEPPEPEETWNPERLPGDLSLIGQAVVHRVSNPLRATKALIRTGRSVATMAFGLIGAQTDRLRPALPFTAPRTMFNKPLTPRRAVAFSQVKFDDVHVVKQAFDAKVNDVVLAACATALRRYLQSHDDLPVKPLIVSVPVSVHGQSEREGTNQVSNMFVRLPVEIEDPVEQLRAIRGETADAKQLHNAMGVHLIQDLAEVTPGGVYNRAMRLYSRTGLVDSLPPVQNLVISNVPGPPVPLYIAGARVVGVYPFGPLIEGAGINLTVLSNMDNMDFGVIGCPDTAPDLWGLAEGFVDAVSELRAAADQA